MSIVPTAAMDVSAWRIIREQADVLAESGIVPKKYFRKPADIIAAAMFGRDLGFSLTASLVLIDVIEGNPTLNAEGKVAKVRSEGHSIVGDVNDARAEVTGKRRDTGDTMTVTFSMTDAARAGLANKTNWKAYPRDMMWSRAVSTLCRRLFSDVIVGLSYTPEEVEAFTSPHEGVRELPSPAPSDGAVASAPPADAFPDEPLEEIVHEDVVNELRVRAVALPDTQRREVARVMREQNLSLLEAYRVTRDKAHRIADLIDEYEAQAELEAPFDRETGEIRDFNAPPVQEDVPTGDRL